VSFDLGVCCVCARALQHVAQICVELLNLNAGEKCPDIQEYLRGKDVWIDGSAL
jgi:hypothetical protein